MSGPARRFAPWMLLLLLLAASGSSFAGSPRPSNSPEAIAARQGLAAAAARPFAVSREMHLWVAATTAALEPEAVPLERLRALHRRWIRDELPPIEEVSGWTPTAAEAFVQRRTDCVGFALLLVALSRDAGVDARFVLAPTLAPALAPAIGATDRPGDLRIRRAHLAVTLDGRTFDLGGERELASEGERIVGDRTALALFYSNRGAQGLALGRTPEAVEWLYRAVRFDPSLAWVWTNLGVALRRNGDVAGAVLAYEMALRLDAHDETARRNLALVRAISP